MKANPTRVDTATGSCGGVNLDDAPVAAGSKMPGGAARSDMVDAMSWCTDRLVDLLGPIYRNPRIPDDSDKIFELSHAN